MPSPSADKAKAPFGPLSEERFYRPLIRTADVYQTDTDNGTIGYSETLLSVVAEFKNSGSPDGANVQSMVGKSKKGEVALRLFARIDEETDIIEHAGFKTRGCLAMTACASVICTMIEGKTCSKALAITAEDVTRALDGIPSDKSHTARFAVESVRALVGHWRLMQLGDRSGTGLSRRMVDEVLGDIGCSLSSVSCMMCEHCSLRDTRFDLMAAWTEGESASDISPDDPPGDLGPAVGEQFAVKLAGLADKAIAFIERRSAAGELTDEGALAAVIRQDRDEAEKALAVDIALEEPLAEESWPTAHELACALVWIAGGDEASSALYLCGARLNVEPQELERVLLERNYTYCESADALRCVLELPALTFYSDRYMTGRYAHLLALSVLGDDLATFADCIRDESRTYPRPMRAASFENEPFCFTAQHVKDLYCAACADRRFADIAQTCASNGDVYYYSRELLSDFYAERLAERRSVGRWANP